MARQEIHEILVENLEGKRPLWGGGVKSEVVPLFI
jgi:hypothetical protein